MVGKSLNLNMLECFFSQKYCGKSELFQGLSMCLNRFYGKKVLIPKKEFSEIPALLIELKWNQSAKTAIEQIKEKSIYRH